MKLKYYGVDAATKSIQFWGLDDAIFSGKFDEETGEWVLNPFGGQLPTTVFANSYRVVDSTDNQIIYQWDGKNYIADFTLTKYGADSFIVGFNNIAPTDLVSFGEDRLAVAASSPLVPILLIAAAYWVFIR